MSVEAAHIVEKALLEVADAIEANTFVLTVVSKQIGILVQTNNHGDRSFALASTASAALVTDMEQKLGTRQEMKSKKPDKEG